MESRIGGFSCLWVLEMFAILVAGMFAELAEQPHDYDWAISLYEDPDKRLGTTGEEHASVGEVSVGGSVEKGAQGRSDRDRDREREEYRRKMEHSITLSIKEEILAKLGRTNTTTTAEESKQESGSSSSGSGRSEADGKKAFAAQVNEIIALADTPVLNATENGTLQFTLKRNFSLNPQHLRVDKAAIFLRLSVGKSNGRHLRHSKRPPAIYVFQVKGSDDLIKLNHRTSGSEPLPIATTSIRVKSTGWQKVPLPSSVVQEVIDSQDSVLRLAFVCENCTILPPASSGNRSRRREERTGNKSRRRHRNGSPYISISTLFLHDRK